MIAQWYDTDLKINVEQHFLNKFSADSGDREKSITEV